jgi:hypothetical protein
MWVPLSKRRGPNIAGLEALEEVRSELAAKGITFGGGAR